MQFAGAVLQSTHPQSAPSRPAAATQRSPATTKEVAKARVSRAASAADDYCERRGQTRNGVKRRSVCCARRKPIPARSPVATGWPSITRRRSKGAVAVSRVTLLLQVKGRRARDQSCFSRIHRS